MSNNLRYGIFLALVASFMFSIKPIFIKQAYAYGADSESLMLLRMWFAFPFYAFMLFLHRKDFVKHKAYILPLSIIGFVGYFLSSYLDLIALHSISAQAERIILYGYPSLVVLFMALYKKQLPSRTMFIALTVVYAGILVLLPGELNINGSSFGLMLMMVCATTYAIYVIASKPLIEKVGVSIFTSVAMVSACLFTQVHLAVVPIETFTRYSSEVYLLALGLAFFSTVIPSYALSAAISMVGAERAAIAGTTGPIFTTLLAVLILDESFTYHHGLGLSLVVIGVYLLGKSK